MLSYKKLPGILTPHLIVGGALQQPERDQGYWRAKRRRTLGQGAARLQDRIVKVLRCGFTAPLSPLARRAATYSTDC